MYKADRKKNSCSAFPLSLSSVLAQSHLLQGAIVWKNVKVNHVMHSSGMSGKRR